MRFKRTLATVATVAVVVAASVVATTTAHADTATDDSVTAAEVSAALNALDARDDKLIVEPVRGTADTDSAAVVRTQNGTVDVPKDINRGIKIAGPKGQHIAILPDSANAQPGSALPDGTVVYPNKKGVATSVAADAQGGIQLTCAIANKRASQLCRYRLQLPRGSKLRIIDGGAVLITSKKGEPISFIKPPFAKDAKGTNVPTSYTVKGYTLTQHVHHRAGNYAYPVVADPWFYRTGYGLILVANFNRSETYQIGRWGNLVQIAGAVFWPVAVVLGVGNWWVNDLYARGRCLSVAVMPGAHWYWERTC